jgi:hypothetical protein
VSQQLARLKASGIIVGRKNGVIMRELKVDGLAAPKRSEGGPKRAASPRWI